MLRNYLFGTIAFSVVFVLAGCAENEAPRTQDAPIKTSEGGKQKKGKVSRTAEISMELPASEAKAPAKK